MLGSVSTKKSAVDQGVWVHRAVVDVMTLVASVRQECVSVDKNSGSIKAPAVSRIISFLIYEPTINTLLFTFFIK